MSFAYRLALLHSEQLGEVASMLVNGIGIGSEGLLALSPCGLAPGLEGALASLYCSIDILGC
jgi:hypothetical protein